MDNKFEELKNALDKFQSCVSKDLEEIRKSKADIQQIQASMEERLDSGQYIRNGRCVIISAPEIIIGNVDAAGNLSADGGKVVIKGSQVDLDGVGEKGKVRSRAALVEQIGVDPGIDGREAVVRDTSMVLSHAKNIILQSNDSKDCFSQMPTTNGKGIRIHSDTTMEIDASASSENRKKAIDKREMDLKKAQAELQVKSTSSKASIDANYVQLQTLIQQHDLLNAADELTRVNYSELEDINLKIQDLYTQLYTDALEYIQTISSLAEINRQVTALDKEKQTIKSGDAFKKNTTNAKLSVTAERMEMKSIDGDGNFHDNKGAGIVVKTPRMYVSMQKEDGSLAENSCMAMQTEKVVVSTANPNKSDWEAKGSVSIYSKDINLLSIDEQKKNKKHEEKALAKEGKITIRAEKMEISATDTEGKATGSIDINAKAVSVKSMNVDKDKRTNKELAKGSTMLLASEKMYVGAQDKKIKSKSLQAVSEEMGLFADKTLEAQQGEAKAVLQLADGNAALSGSKTQVYGETTINAKTEVKDELKAPKATIDNIEAKSSFKSSNLSDGIPVPPAPASAKLSAKLKSEDLKSE